MGNPNSGEIFNQRIQISKWCENTQSFYLTRNFALTSINFSFILKPKPDTYPKSKLNSVHTFVLNLSPNSKNSTSFED